MKKRITVLLLTLCLVIAYAGSVSAKEDLNSGVENEYARLDTIEGIDLESHRAESERLVQLGELVSKRRENPIILSGFQNLQQSNSAWGNVVMQTCGQTIGKSGCCLTSFTMIQRYYGGTDNPAQVNAKLGNAACPFVYGTAASKYGYTYNLASSSSVANFKSYIKGAIASGNPVLIGMEYAGGTHFVAAYGYNGDEIIISDPASVNYQYLSDYLNKGYTVYRLCTYFK